MHPHTRHQQPLILLRFPCKTNGQTSCWKLQWRVEDVICHELFITAPILLSCHSFQSRGLSQLTSLFLNLRLAPTEKLPPQCYWYCFPSDTLLEMMVRPDSWIVLLTLGNAFVALPRIVLFFFLHWLRPLNFILSFDFPFYGQFSAPRAFKAHYFSFFSEIFSSLP